MQPPSCPHFGHCGGCTLLDRPIEEQLRTKAETVRTALAPHLGDTAVNFVPPPRVPRHDRMRILYPVQPHADRGLTMGIYARSSHDVVEIEDCAIQDPSLTALGRHALQVFRELELTPYDEASQTGHLRAFHARLMNSGELLMAVVTRSGTLPRVEELVRRLVAIGNDLRTARGRRVRTIGLLRNIHDRPGNFLIGAQTECLWGRDYQLDRSDGLTFRVRFPAFYQTHRLAHAILYRRALQLVGDLAGLSVVDGYGGVGTFALRMLSGGAARAQVVEENPAACADARWNATANDLDSRFEVCEAPFADSQPWSRPDLLVVDPPRAGLGADGAAKVLDCAPRRILHVACSVTALARDLDRLGPGGFRLRRVEIADLFPHTEHIEVLALSEGPA